ncbi:MAG: hypothetical protein IKL86_02900 [Clostridia bacterium]|nr:hypothetical protein [Clostridia bacterium]
MSKKSEKKNQVAAAPAAEETTPVAQPAKAVQLTPIIQPIAFVPYSTQDQPLYMYDEEEEVAVEEEVEEEVVVAPKKKVSAAAIFLSIFSLLIVGLYVIANWVMPDMLGLIDGQSGLAIIMGLVETMDFSNIMNIALAVVPVMAVLTLIASLIRIMKKGACVFAKITTFLGLVAVIAALLLALIDGGYAIGYGLYAVAALSLINVLIAYLAKND